MLDEDQSISLVSIGDACVVLRHLVTVAEVERWAQVGPDAVRPSIGLLLPAAGEIPEAVTTLCSAGYVVRILRRGAVLPACLV